MDLDQSQAQALKSKSLQNLTTGSLSSSISALSGSSRGISSGKDFHFFYNFEEFKSPIQEITGYSQSMLESIGSSSRIWSAGIAYPEDPDDAYDWLVNVNDEVFERFDTSVDEFQRLRKIEEETGKPVMDLDDGFQLVYGKKKNKGGINSGSGSASGSVKDKDNLSVKVATKDKKVTGTKPKVPFHIPTIRKPQEEFNILVNNLNQPFEHVWLQRSEDDQRFIHPLEKLSVLDFVDKDITVEPIKPPPIDSTPFKLVEEVKDLKMLAAKLRSVNEFAVDLEHNQYRSFQGLTCLMQISTRTEDFVVDTLKLRIHIGPYLREVFKDPTKKKVMHGADRDIVWLQRDFGIYICNLFDTGQASRVLKLERNSLEYLLHHFCGVTANKEYQNAEWRLRPLPDEMIRYAREDTHYLLYIYDLMKLTLLSMSKETEDSDSPLLEVYKRSYNVCMQLYEKEILTENSYLYVYGLQGAGFNAQQIAIVAGLCEWRDVVARAEDESTGYILPNRTLLEIAKEMPVTASKLRRLVKSKHPYIERNLGSVVSIIRHSIENAPAYEAAAEHLKEGRMEMPLVENTVNNDVSEVVSPDTHSNLSNATAITESIGGNTSNGNVSALSSASVEHKEESLQLECHTEHGRDGQVGSSGHPGEITKANIGSGIHALETLRESIVTGESRITRTEMATSDAATSVTGATIQVPKKSNSAFGALLGNTAPKRKLDTDKRYKEEMKLEQIRCSVNLPFNSFLERNDQPKPAAAKAIESQQPEKPPVDLSSTPKLEDVIMLGDNSHVEESLHDESVSDNEHTENNSAGSALETDKNELMSLSDLSTSFQKCFDSSKQSKKSGLVDKSEESGSPFQLKPFNYEAARKHVCFGDQKEDSGDSKTRLDCGSRKKGSAGRVQRDNETSDFAQGRRRHAFPATGNRSATFR